METDIHECKWYKGKISDVTVRSDGNIHCKSCCEKLKNEQVESEMLKRIEREKGERDELKNNLHKL